MVRISGTFFSFIARVSSFLPVIIAAQRCADGCIISTSGAIVYDCKNIVAKNL